MFENFDLTNIISPVDADQLKSLLIESKYCPQKTEFLVKGFREGFSIGYEGDENVKQSSPNLQFHTGDETILWNKVMKEVKAKRYAGPYDRIPYDTYIQSPIGLVPKDGGKDVCLIFHLSHPRKDNTSVNANIPKDLCTVHYPDFNRAIQLCLRSGKGCKLSKSDMKSAFRNLGLKKSQWRF